MNDQAAIWNSLLASPDAARVLGTAMERVAHGLSGMLGQAVGSAPPQVKRIPIAQVSACLGSPEAETAGVYMEIKSGLRGWAILTFPLEGALNLADLMTGAPPGTATRLGLEERSALAEAGNLALSYFLNAVAELTGRPEALLSSPPAVIVDMLGAVLELAIMPAATLGDELLMIACHMSTQAETTFRGKARTVQVSFWLLPNLPNLNGL